MSVVKEIVATAFACLEAILDDSGHFLYSSAATLRPGAIYLLGHNPGGNPRGRENESIRQSLEGLPRKTTNNYVDDSWVLRAAGKSPLQKRVRWLLQNLDFETTDVCASNLIFSRSVDAASSNFGNLAAICWPVHEVVLRTVKPKLIDCFGNSDKKSPYAFLRDKLDHKCETTHESGHGKWKCKFFRTNSGLVVVGLPHLSRYAVNHHAHVPEWIKRTCPLTSASNSEEQRYVE